MKRAVLSRFRESRPLHYTDSASLNSVIYSTRDSDTSPTWKNCPNLEAHLCSYPCAWNYQKRFIVYGSRGGLSAGQWLPPAYVGGGNPILGRDPWLWGLCRHPWRVCPDPRPPRVPLAPMVG